MLLFVEIVLLIALARYTVPVMSCRCQGALKSAFGRAEDQIHLAECLEHVISRFPTSMF